MCCNILSISFDISCSILVYLPNETMFVFQDLPEHGVTTIFVNLENTKLELLHPFGDNSPIQNFLAKKPGGGVHHLCYEVRHLYYGTTFSFV